MHYIIKVWQWLDGNKTLFGLVFLTIAAQIDSNPFEPNYLKMTFEALGATLTGGGVLHKIKKGRANTGKQQY